MNDDFRADDSSSPEWRVPEEQQLETDAYHIWKPRPLLRSVHWRPVPATSREDAAGSYDVFVDQRVFRAMHQHVWNAAPDQNPFGFLAGDLCEDPDTGRRYVIISAAIPARFQLEESGDEQIPAQALVAMQLEVERRRGVLAGWYHRHPDGDVALTEADVVTHEMHFREPWQVAVLFVTDHAQPTGGLFRRTRSGLKGDLALPFFEMVSNESLLARGLRRSHWDWENVETADSIQSEPPARPAPPPMTVEPETPEDVAESSTVRSAEALEDVPEPAIEVESAEPVPDLDARSGDEEVAAIDLPDVPGAEEATTSPPVPFDDELDVVLPLIEVPAPSVEPLAADEEERLAAIARDLDAADAELDLAEKELGMMVDAEAAAVTIEEESAESADAMPEPAWDSEAESTESLEPPDDVDLDSFVTEVESADVDGQVDALEPPLRAEPDWEALDAEGLILEPLAPQAAAGDLPTDLEEVQQSETIPERVPAVPKKRRKAGGRPAALMVVATMVIVAVAASLITLARSSAEDEALDVVRGSTDQAQTEVQAETGEATPEPAAQGGVPGEGTGDPGPVSEARMEELGESLLESVSRYYGLAVAAEEGRASCSDLQEGYIQVEDRWIAYNVEGKARYRGRLPERLAARDERLYQGVRDVETEFGRSGCSRP